MAYTDKELQSAYVKSKIGLMRAGAIFLTTIVFSLKHQFTKAIPTAGVDGINLFINPDFFMKLNSEERIGLFAHEAWHVALMHPIRGKNKIHKKYNRAGDYIINGLLIEAGFKIPTGGFHDTKYRNWTTASVYNDLDDNDDSKTDPFGEDIIYIESIPDELKKHLPDNITPNILQREIQNKILTAKTQTEVEGKNIESIPGDLQKLFNELTNPVIPWGDLLYNYMTAICKNDYSWKRLNKRYLPTYLPGQYSEGLGKIVLAYDTSGSVCDKDIQEFLSESQHIYDVFKPREAIFLDCDKEIHNIHRINPDSYMNILDLKFTGGGGTSFKPVIEFCKEEEPDLLIYFTDLYARPITEDPGFPILWICYSDHEPAPIGETIYYTLYGD